MWFSPRSVTGNSDVACSNIILAYILSIFYHSLQTLLLVGTFHMLTNSPFNTTFMPRQAKVLAEGGDLREAQVDVPQLV